MATAEIKRHWDRVANLNCIVTGSPYPTIHHIHGGSVTDIGVRRGMGQKMSDWLVIPLRWDYHLGPMGIDSGCMSVREWEEKVKEQVDLMDEVCRRLKLNCWAKAGFKRKVAGLDK